MGGKLRAWRDCKLGDVLELKRGYDLPSHHRHPGPVPIVSSSGPSGFHSDAMVQAPGVVTGRYGTIGEVFFVTQDFWPLNTTLYVRDFKGSDPKFVSYFLKTIDFYSCSDKAAVPGVNRNHLHELPVRVPPLAEQRAIARILGALDDKIELNRKMNATLEAMARALFKSWFVDFDPVRAKAEGRAPSGMDAETAALFPSEFVESELGAIPKGWSIEPLDSLAEFRNGLALQKFRPAEGAPSLPVVKIAQLRTGQPDSGEWATDDIPVDCILENGDVVFSWSGSLTVVVWCGGRAALNQHLFRVTSAHKPKWFYLQWLLHHLPEFQRIAGDKATTMGHIQRHHLRAARCIVPDRSVLDAAGHLLAPLLERTIALDLERRQLARLRDELLPRLISGELSVGAAEREVASTPESYSPTFATGDAV